MDSKSEKVKGFAYVLMDSSESAVCAFEELNGRAFQGRLLHILPASPKKENGLDDFALSKLPLKKQKEIKRKSAAAANQFSWNSMYMNVIKHCLNLLGECKLMVCRPMLLCLLLRTS
jgi:multiple RNA-binding domain-containing protein 1